VSQYVFVDVNGALALPLVLEVGERAFREKQAERSLECRDAALDADWMRAAWRCTHTTRAAGWLSL